jgi:hypothetical protein
MKYHSVLLDMKRKIILFLILLMLLACNSPRLVSPTITPAPVASPTVVNMPGIVVRGHVTINGAGLAGVNVYKRFSAYPRDLIATTDKDGYYESAFIPIPGDEMVSVEAELAGYTFDPPYHYWRHYYGYELTTLDFVATAAP